MSGAMRRAIAGGVAALAVWVFAEIAYTAVLCPAHHAWLAVKSGRTQVVVERGERVSRVGDATFACETTHRLGPVAWHQDLDCYCAPAGTPPAAVAAAIGGVCTLDEIHPSIIDGSGSCRYARCNHYVDVRP